MRADDDLTVDARSIRQLRILQVIGDSALGGAERHLQDLATGLHARGDHVIVVCPRPGPLTNMLTAAGIDVEFLDFVRPLPRDGYGFDPAAAAALQTLIRRQRSDVVHSHLFTAHLHATIAAERCSVPAIVTTAHTRVTRRVDADLARETRVQVIACAQAVVSALRAAMVPADRITLIPNGVNHIHFTPLPHRNRSGALAVSRLSREKGIDVLVKAAAIVRVHWPELRILVAGTGPEHDELCSLRRELHLQDTVHFLGDRHDIAHLMRGAEMVICPSRDDAASLSVLEAMATGAPVIATAVGGTPEIVTHAGDGVLVGADDPWALAQAVMAVHNDPQQRARLSSSARATVVGRFTFGRQLARTRDLYRQLIDVNARP
jgi:glycosyltransferase involved in cell wall biosynthesis